MKVCPLFSLKQSVSLKATHLRLSALLCECISSMIPSHDIDASIIVDAMKKVLSAGSSVFSKDTQRGGSIPDWQEYADWYSVVLTAVENGFAIQNYKISIHE